MTNGVISVRGAKNAAVKIPAAEAPAALRQKLELNEVTQEAKTAQARGFALLEATEAEVTKRYGAPIDSGTSDLKPATRRAIYDIQGIRLTVHYIEGKPGFLMATRPGGKLTQREADALLARCGSKWTNAGVGDLPKCRGSNSDEGGWGHYGAIGCLPCGGMKARRDAACDEDGDSNVAAPRRESEVAILMNTYTIRMLGLGSYEL